MKVWRPPVDANGFKNRSPEVSRIEGFSDAVFGFSLTLLVVALEVPKSFDDLLAHLRGFAAFGGAFAMLYYVWNLHYLYCRRFGLEDAAARTMTGALLFVVALYVYPLKFLSALFFGSLLGLDRSNGYVIKAGQMATLFQIYGLGFVLIFGLFSMMYGYAHRCREALEMGAVERFATKSEARTMSLFAGVGLLSISLATFLPAQWVGLAGYCYSLVGVIGGYQGGVTGRKIREMEAKAAKPLPVES